MPINSTIRQRTPILRSACDIRLQTYRVHELTASAYHPSGNDGVERVNHTMAQMLFMVCNEH